MINLAQVRMSVQASDNGTFADPVAFSFAPPAYVLASPTRAVRGSVIIGPNNAIATPIPGQPPCGYKGTISHNAGYIVTSLSVQNGSLTDVVYVAVTELSTVAGYTPVVSYIPLSPSGILTLSGRFDGGAVDFFAPNLQDSADYILIGNY